MTPHPMGKINPKKIELTNLKNCPVCGGGSRKSLFPIKSSEVFECLACCLRYLSPCLSPNAMKEVYESDETLAQLHDFHKGYYEYGDLSRKSRTLRDFNSGLALLEKCLGPAASERTIFDVGFGNGFFLAAAKKRGWKVDGIDTSQKNVSLAYEKFSLQLSHGSLETLEDRRGMYDAVSFWDVIEHLPDPHAALEKAKQILKPRGLVLVGLPNDKNLLALIALWLYRASSGRIRKGIETLYFLEHVAYYNLDTLSALFKRHQFVRREYFLTNTDLSKYALPFWEKTTAACLLGLSTLVNLENRLVAVFQKE